MNSENVWMAHFCEVPGFSADKENGYPKAHFQEEVLDYIANGVATPMADDEHPIQNKKLADIKDSLQGADVFVISLQKSDSDDSYVYADQLKKVQDTIDEQLGRGNAKFHKRTYKRPQDDNDVLPILFEYDPKPRRARVLMHDHDVLLDGEPGKF